MELDRLGWDGNLSILSLSLSLSARNTIHSYENNNHSLKRRRKYYLSSRHPPPPSPSENRSTGNITTPVNVLALHWNPFISLLEMNAERKT